MKHTLAGAFLCAVSGTAAACPGNLSALIKPGHFGAESVHAYKKGDGPAVPYGRPESTGVLW